MLRQGGTEAPGSGAYLHTTDAGVYACMACGAELFTSDSKYTSNIASLEGWPSFCEAAQNDALTLLPDTSFGMQRTEVRCAKCDSHLGHLFPDSSSPNGQHYCINSVALDFSKQD